MRALSLIIGIIGLAGCASPGPDTIPEIYPVQGVVPPLA